MKTGFLDILVVSLITLPLLIAISLLYALPVWLIWNYVGPSVFGGPEIDFLKIWGILFLMNYVFSGFKK